MMLLIDAYYLFMTMLRPIPGTLRLVVLTSTGETIFITSMLIDGTKTTIRRLMLIQLPSVPPRLTLTMVNWFSRWSLKNTLSFTKVSTIDPLK